MKIGIDIRLIGKKQTGSESVVFNLVKNLAKIDSENKYLLFTDTDDATVLQYVILNLEIGNKNNFKIISLKTANKFVWNAWTLPHYLRENLLDVYHTQYILPFFVPKRTKLITHIHDISFNFYPQFIKWADLFFLKTLIPWSIRKAAKVITVSEASKQEIMKYYHVPEEKIDVVYNSIGENFSKNYSADDLAKMKGKYNLPEKFLLYIGTLQPRKNIPFLVRAFARMKEGMPEYKLVLVGQRKAHNYDQEIDTVIEGLKLQKSVVFPGYIETADLPTIYQMADVFVFPSLFEGFGIPLLEAMASGTPVAASDIPVFREVAKEAAEYFDPESLDELMKVVYNISINPELKNKLINSGQARIKFFSWAKSAEKLLGIYQSFKY